MGFKPLPPPLSIRSIIYPGEWGCGARELSREESLLPSCDARTHPEMPSKGPYVHNMIGLKICFPPKGGCRALTPRPLDAECLPLCVGRGPGFCPEVSPDHFRCFLSSAPSIPAEHLGPSLPFPGLGFPREDSVTSCQCCRFQP